MWPLITRREIELIMESLGTTPQASLQFWLMILSLVTVWLLIRAHFRR